MTKKSILIIFILISALLVPTVNASTSTTVYHSTTVTATYTITNSTTMSEYLVTGTTITSTSTVSNTSSTTTLYSTTTTIVDGTTVISVDQTITVDELESELIDHNVGLEGGGVTTILTLVGILAAVLVLGFIVMKRRRR